MPSNYQDDSFYEDWYKDSIMLRKMMNINLYRLCVLSLMGVNIAIFSFGCGHDAAESAKGHIITDELNEPARHYKIGKPYVIRGKKYFPKEDYKYQRTGTASWYGGPDHGKPTANGEIFDENLMTAAHKTLPLPSVVRVTNLENGKSIVVRVNDRGPFIGKRIIDVSRRGAEILGFEGKGLAKVHVKLLPEQSRALKKASLDAKKKRVRDSKIVKKNAKRNQFEIVTPVDPGHYVQIASFTESKAGQDYVEKQTLKESISLFETILDRGTFFRVMVGPVKDYDQAEKLQAKLKKLGYKDSFIVDVPK